MAVAFRQPRRIQARKYETMVGYPKRISILDHQSMFFPIGISWTKARSKQLEKDKAERVVAKKQMDKAIWDGLRLEENIRIAKREERNPYRLRRTIQGLRKERGVAFRKERAARRRVISLTKSIAILERVRASSPGGRRPGGSGNGGSGGVGLKRKKAQPRRVARPQRQRQRVAIPVGQ